MRPARRPRLPGARPRSSHRVTMRWNTPRVASALLVMERLDRIETRGAHRRIETEHDPDRDRDAEGEDDRAGRDDRGPTRQHADQLRQADAEEDPGHATGQRNDRGLDQELADD